jgi:cob(I)alamin adenosyltransferase
MKIYTKTGDRGKTSLFGGSRVSKDDKRIEAYGTVDELNSIIGVCRSISMVREIDHILHQIQNDLFILGADLATPLTKKSSKIRRLLPADIKRLEKHIDTIDPLLTPLKKFILPGGNRSASMLHFSRTVCRRAERLVVHLSHAENIGSSPVIYLNRLSDLLFVLARRVNALSNTTETKWNPK